MGITPGEEADVQEIGLMMAGSEVEKRETQVALCDA
jgi:Fe2+ transport system protein FeoA